MSIDNVGEDQELSDTQTLAGAYARIDGNSTHIKRHDDEIGHLRNEVGSLKDGYNSQARQLKELDEKLTKMSGASEAQNKVIMDKIDNSDAKNQKYYADITTVVEGMSTFVSSEIKAGVKEIYTAIGIDINNPIESGRDYIKIRDGVSKRVRMWDEIKTDITKWGIRIVMGGIVGFILIGFKEWTAKPITANVQVETRDK